jgi:chromosomal replication initiation ATPase DnaA
VTTSATPPRRGGPGAPGDQYVFNLPHATALTRPAFVAASANAAALDWIERWPDWPATALALWGPAGAGKSHLARIWRERAYATQIAPDAVRDDALPDLLGAADAVLIDDADGAAEEPLLHLFNMLAERGGHLLIVARAPPARWGMRLPDLRSRLLACPVVAVAAPDEDLIAALLVKLFADRRLSVSRELVAFLSRRLERRFQAAQDAVADLDRAAASEQRPITVPLARRVLELSDAEPPIPPPADPSG